MNKLKAKMVPNCGYEEAGEVRLLPFIVVENQHGKFICHWTVRPNEGPLHPNNFHGMNFIKYTQLACLESPWLNEDRRIFIIEVADGGKRSMKDKIEEHCQGMAPGQRVLFVLPNKHVDDAFYKALKMLPPQPKHYSVMAREGIDCCEPWNIYDMGGAI